MLSIRIIMVALLVLLASLQLRLWHGPGSLADLHRLNSTIAVQTEKNTTLQARNRHLQAEVGDLKQGLAAVEALARSELGMIRQGETFFQIIER